MSCGHIKCEQLQAVGTSDAGQSLGSPGRVWPQSSVGNFTPRAGTALGSHLGVRGVDGRGLAAEPLPDMLQAGGPVPLHRLVLCAGARCICRAEASPLPPCLAATGRLGSSACSYVCRAAVLKILHHVTEYVGLQMCGGQSSSSLCAIPTLQGREGCAQHAPDQAADPSVSITFCAQAACCLMAVVTFSLQQLTAQTCTTSIPTRHGTCSAPSRHPVHRLRPRRPH